ncbi:hypothetical protein F5B17DRAFT_442397 [Nemania serpens]|nr:hypothetical protein F5B17DRAFT_442397 [Nemania serpens]
MDWVRDASGLHSWDLDRVFKYDPKPTTVLRITENKAVIWSIETHEEWAQWIELDSQSGLVVLFARRSEEPTHSKAKRCCGHHRLKGIEVDLSGLTNTPQRLEPMQLRTDNPSDEKINKPSQGGRRGLRTMPFSRSTFEMISKAFYMHSSVSRMISRADIPVFSHTGAIMKDEHGSNHEASVFGCRTSNAWAMDLALTVTYFPRCNLKLAVVFGCDLFVEEDIINRLVLAREDASHPLLLPGIIVETERRRHVKIVDDIVDEVEARIFQLEVRPDAEYSMTTFQMEELHREKRSAWLNITYVRNCLLSWRKQLENLILQVDELDRSFLSRSKGHALFGESSKPTELAKALTTYLETDDSDLWQKQFGNSYLTTAYKIKSRVRAIIEEYDDKIRDCAIRIDGMAMATQWAQGETSLEISKTTSRDSTHMRSIALVTMVFLPGTFLAGVFSMTFFNWSDDTGPPAISKYIWIYIVLATLFTVLTVALWYYFNIHRKRGSKGKITEV